MGFGCIKFLIIAFLFTLHRGSCVERGLLEKSSQIFQEFLYLYGLIMIMVCVCMLNAIFAIHEHD